MTFFTPEQRFDYLESMISFFEQIVRRSEKIVGEKIDLDKPFKVVAIQLFTNGIKLEVANNNKPKPEIPFHIPSNNPISYENLPWGTVEELQKEQKHLANLKAGLDAEYKKSLMDAEYEKSLMGYEKKDSFAFSHDDMVKLYDKLPPEIENIEPLGSDEILKSNDGSQES